MAKNVIVTITTKFDAKSALAEVERLSNAFNQLQEQANNFKAAKAFTVDTGSSIKALEAFRQAISKTLVAVSKLTEAFGNSGDIAKSIGALRESLEAFSGIKLRSKALAGFGDAIVNFVGKLTAIKTIVPQVEQSLTSLINKFDAFIAEAERLMPAIDKLERFIKIADSVKVVDAALQREINTLNRYAREANKAIETSANLDRDLINQLIRVKKLEGANTGLIAKLESLRRAVDNNEKASKEYVKIMRETAVSAAKEGKEFSSLAESLRNFEVKTVVSSRALKGLRGDLEKLHLQLSHAKNLTDEERTALLGLNRVIEKVAIRAGLQEPLVDVANSMVLAGVQTDRLSAKFKNLSAFSRITIRTLQEIPALISRSVSIFLTYGAFDAVRNGIRAVIDSLISFEGELGRTKVLLLGQVSSVDKINSKIARLREGIKQLDGLYGNLAEQAESTYRIISSGVIDVEAALKVHTDAMKFATVTGANLEEATKLIVSAMSAFASEAVTSSEAANALLATVQLGNLRFEDFGQTMGRTFGAAQRFGIGLSELGAVLTTLSRRGIRGKEAVTSLFNILNSLEGRSKEAKDELERLGVSIVDIAKSSKTPLTDWFLAIQSAADNADESFSKITGNLRAKRGVFALLVDDFKELQASQQFINKAMEEGTRLNEAFAVVSEHLQVIIDRLANNVVRLGVVFSDATGITDLAKITIDAFATVLGSFTDAFLAVVNVIKDVISPLTQLITSYEHFGKIIKAVSLGFAAASIVKLGIAVKSLVKIFAISIATVIAQIKESKRAAEAATFEAIAIDRLTAAILRLAGARETEAVAASAAAKAETAAAAATSAAAASASVGFFAKIKNFLGTLLPTLSKAAGSVLSFFGIFKNGLGTIIKFSSWLFQLVSKFNVLFLAISGGLLIYDLFFSKTDDGTKKVNKNVSSLEELVSTLDKVKGKLSEISGSEVNFFKKAQFDQAIAALDKLSVVGRQLEFLKDLNITVGGNFEAVSQVIQTAQNELETLGRISDDTASKLIALGKSIDLSAPISGASAQLSALSGNMQVFRDRIISFFDSIREELSKDFLTAGNIEFKDVGFDSGILQQIEEFVTLVTDVTAPLEDVKQQYNEIIQLLLQLGVGTTEWGQTLIQNLAHLTENRFALDELKGSLDNTSISLDVAKAKLEEFDGSLSHEGLAAIVNNLTEFAGVLQDVAFKSGEVQIQFDELAVSFVQRAAELATSSQEFANGMLLLNPITGELVEKFRDLVPQFDALNSKAKEKAIESLGVEIKKLVNSAKLAVIDISKLTKSTEQLNAESKLVNGNIGHLTELFTKGQFNKAAVEITRIASSLTSVYTSQQPLAGQARSYAEALQTVIDRLKEYFTWQNKIKDAGRGLFLKSVQGSDAYKRSIDRAANSLLYYKAGTDDFNEALGRSVDTVLNVMSNMGQYSDQLEDNTTRQRLQDQILSDVVKALEEKKKAEEDAAGATNDHSNALDRNNKNLKDQKDAAEDAADSNKKQGDSAKDAGDATKKQGDASKKTAEDQKKLKDSTDQVSGGYLNLSKSIKDTSNRLSALGDGMREIFFKFNGTRQLPHAGQFLNINQVVGLQKAIGTASQLALLIAENNFEAARSFVELNNLGKEFGRTIDELERKYKIAQKAQQIFMATSFDLLLPMKDLIQLEKELDKVSGGAGKAILDQAEKTTFKNGALVRLKLNLDETANKEKDLTSASEDSSDKLREQANEAMRAGESLKDMGRAAERTSGSLRKTYDSAKDLGVATREISLCKGVSDSKKEVDGLTDSFDALGDTVDDVNVCEKAEETAKKMRDIAVFFSGNTAVVGYQEMAGALEDVKESAESAKDSVEAFKDALVESDETADGSVSKLEEVRSGYERIAEAVSTASSAISTYNSLSLGQGSGGGGQLGTGSGSGGLLGDSTGGSGGGLLGAGRAAAPVALESPTKSVRAKLIAESTTIAKAGTTRAEERTEPVNVNITINADVVDDRSIDAFARKIGERLETIDRVDSGRVGRLYLRY